MFQRVRMQLRSWRLVLVVAVLASVPALSSQLVSDDYLHRGAYTGAIPDYERDAFSLYDFITDDQDAMRVMRERGYVPWWSSDDLRVRFFRPLSSATLAADIELFGDAAMPALAHSALYFIGSVMVVFAIFSMLLPARSAVLGACIYALAGGHAIPLSWLAARHALMAAFFGLLALWFHLRFRERGYRPGRWLSLAALAVAMLSSEAALGAVALICFHELLGARGTWRQRALACAPVVLLTLGYLAWYKAAGYGARGTGMYIDPLHDPAAFLAAAATRLPSLLADMLASIPSITYSVAPGMALVLPMLGFVFVALTGALYASVRPALSAETRRSLRWLMAGSLAALLPVSAGLIGGRLLTIAMLGGAAVIGSVASHLFERKPSRKPRAVTRAACVLQLGLVMGLGALLHLFIPWLYGHVGAAQWRVATESELECAAGSDAVLLAAADPSVTNYAPAAMVLSGRTPLPRALWVLSMAPQDHRIQVVSEHGFELSVVGPRKSNWWESVHRKQPLRVGQKIQIRDMTIEVLGVAEHGATSVSVHFERPLSAPSLCFLEWREDKLRNARLPRPGHSRLVPFEPDLMMR